MLISWCPVLSLCRSCSRRREEFPGFFLPRPVASAARRRTVLFEAVDSNGLLPIRSADQVAFRAFGFRRCFSNNLNPHRLTMPSRIPRKPSSSAKGASIITCACSGAKKILPRSLSELAAGNMIHLTISTPLVVAFPIPVAAFLGFSVARIALVLLSDRASARSAT
jgi:hypothetical protein